jgi:hypothetical protein
MATDKECIDYARECVRLAGLTQDRRTGEDLLNMAREWLALAMHEEKITEPKALR